MSNGTTERRHVFISHHHKDDANVDAMTKLLGEAGCGIRNSSIRALRPENQDRIKNGKVKDETICRWLRAKISWAGAVVVLIGKETHTRQWVNWEIQEAMRQGKRIIGVWEQGGKDSDIPESLRKYGNAVVGWQSERILGAIDGQINNWSDPNGNEYPARHIPRARC
jgi:hypothetical protein